MYHTSLPQVPLMFIPSVIIGYYCPISINSAAPVTCDTPAEILVSADARNGRDIIFFPAGWAEQIFIFIVFIYHILK
jgi:hypothetical protein